MKQARTARRTDFDDVMKLLAQDPIESVAIASWLEREGPAGLERRNLWIYDDAVCFSGANLLPMNANQAAARAFARRAIDEGRRCSSIVGRLPAISTMWLRLEPFWGRARAVRERQIVMVIEDDPQVAPDPDVRLAVASDFNAFYNASIEMYIEEIEASPIAHDGGSSYRRRISELLSDQYAFVRTDGERVIFKAELGAVTSACAQLQGVWVHPDYRGQGIGAAGTAQVVSLARERGMGTISLAVNDYNESACHIYRRCGFRPIAEQMVVLF